MNYRLNSTAMWIVGLLLVIAVGLFAYTYFGGDEASPEPPQEEQNGEAAAGGNGVITAKHQFENGVHTIAGETTVPTPCHALDAEAFFVEGNQGEVEVRFTTSTQDEMCAQVVTPVRFKVQFEAPEAAAISATLNGGPVTLNLIPAAEGEDLDDFDVFIKG